MSDSDPFTDPAPDPEPAIGPLEAAVREDLAKLNLVTSTARSLEQLAYTLARKLDDGAGMATAAVAKELRETLAAMVADAGDDGDAEIIARLSAPMGDTPHP